MLMAGLAGLFSSGAVVTLLVTQDVRGAAFPASEYGTECSVAAVSETDGCTCYGGPLCGTQLPRGFGQFALRHAPQVSDQAQGRLRPRPASACLGHTGLVFHTGGADRRKAFLAAGKLDPDTVALDLGSYFNGGGLFFPILRGNASAEFFAGAARAPLPPPPPPLK